MIPLKVGDIVSFEIDGRVSYMEIEKIDRVERGSRLVDDELERESNPPNVLVHVALDTDGKMKTLHGASELRLTCLSLSVGKAMECGLYTPPADDKQGIFHAGDLWPVDAAMLQNVRTKAMVGICTGVTCRLEDGRMLQTIPSGEILKLNGIPVRLVADTQVECGTVLDVSNSANGESGFKVDKVNGVVTFDRPVVSSGLNRWSKRFLRWRYKFFRWLTGAEWELVNRSENLNLGECSGPNDVQLRSIRHLRKQKPEMTHGGQIAKPVSSVPQVDF